VNPTIKGGHTTLLRPKLAETISGTLVKNELSSTSIQLLTALHSIKGIKQERHQH